MVWKDITINFHCIRVLLLIERFFTISHLVTNGYHLSFQHSWSSSYLCASAWLVLHLHFKTILKLKYNIPLTLNTFNTVFSTELDWPDVNTSFVVHIACVILIFNSHKQISFLYTNNIKINFTFSLPPDLLNFFCIYKENNSEMIIE